VERQLRAVVCQKIEGNGDHAGEVVHVWKNKIKFSNVGRKVTANYEKLAADYLDACLR
jgi:hypothetical protein